VLKLTHLRHNEAEKIYEWAPLYGAAPPERERKPTQVAHWAGRSGNAAQIREEHSWRGQANGGSSGSIPGRATREGWRQWKGKCALM